MYRSLDCLGDRWSHAGDYRSGERMSFDRASRQI